MQEEYELSDCNIEDFVESSTLFELKYIKISIWQEEVGVLTSVQRETRDIIVENISEHDDNWEKNPECTDFYLLDFSSYKLMSTWRLDL